MEPGSDEAGVAPTSLTGPYGERHTRNVPVVVGYTAGGVAEDWNDDFDLSSDGEGEVAVVSVESTSEQSSFPNLVKEELQIRSRENDDDDENWDSVFQDEGTLVGASNDSSRKSLRESLPEHELPVGPHSSEGGATGNGDPSTSLDGQITGAVDDGDEDWDEEFGLAEDHDERLSDHSDSIDNFRFMVENFRHILHSEGQRRSWSQLPRRASEDLGTAIDGDFDGGSGSRRSLGSDGSDDPEDGRYRLRRSSSGLTPPDDYSPRSSRQDFAGGNKRRPSGNPATPRTGKPSTGGMPLHLPRRCKLVQQAKMQHYVEILRYPKPIRHYALRSKDGYLPRHDKATELWLKSLISNQDAAAYMSADCSNPKEELNAFQRRQSDHTFLSPEWITVCVDYAWMLHRNCFYDSCWRLIKAYFRKLGRVLLRKRRKKPSAQKSSRKAPALNGIGTRTLQSADIAGPEACIGTLCLLEIGYEVRARLNKSEGWRSGEGVVHNSKNGGHKTAGATSSASMGKRARQKWEKRLQHQQKTYGNMLKVAAASFPSHRAWVTLIELRSAVHVLEEFLGGGASGLRGYGSKPTGQEIRWIEQNPLVDPHARSLLSMRSVGFEIPPAILHLYGSLYLRATLAKQESGPLDANTTKTYEPGLGPAGPKSRGAVAQSRKEGATESVGGSVNSAPRSQEIKRLTVDAGGQVGSMTSSPANTSLSSKSRLAEDTKYSDQDLDLDVIRLIALSELHLCRLGLSPTTGETVIELRDASVGDFEDEGEDGEEESTDEEELWEEEEEVDEVEGISEAEDNEEDDVLSESYESTEELSLEGGRESCASQDLRTTGDAHIEHILDPNDRQGEDESGPPSGSRAQDRNKLKEKDGFPSAVWLEEEAQEILCNPLYRLDLMVKLYSAIAANIHRLSSLSKLSMVKAAYVMGLHMLNETQDPSTAEQVLYDCVAILSELQPMPAKNLQFVTPFGTKVLELFGDILIRNGKYRYAVLAFEAGMLSYKLRERVEHDKLNRRLCTLTHNHGDVRRAFRYHLKILQSSRVELNVNEFVYISEILSRMLLDQGRYDAAEDYLLVALSFVSQAYGGVHHRLQMDLSSDILGNRHLLVGGRDNSTATSSVRRDLSPAERPAGVHYSLDHRLGRGHIPSHRRSRSGEIGGSRDDAWHTHQLSLQLKVSEVYRASMRLQEENLLLNRLLFGRLPPGKRPRVEMKLATCLLKMRHLDQCHDVLDALALAACPHPAASPLESQPQPLTVKLNRSQSTAAAESHGVRHAGGVEYSGVWNELSPPQSPSNLAWALQSSSGNRGRSLTSSSLAHVVGTHAGSPVPMTFLPLDLPSQRQSLAMSRSIEYMILRARAFLYAYKPVSALRWLEIAMRQVTPTDYQRLGRLHYLQAVGRQQLSVHNVWIEKAGSCRCKFLSSSEEEAKIPSFLSQGPSSSTRAGTTRRGELSSKGRGPAGASVDGQTEPCPDDADEKVTGSKGRTRTSAESSSMLHEDNVIKCEEHYSLAYKYFMASNDVIHQCKALAGLGQFFLGRLLPKRFGAPSDGESRPSPTVCFDDNDEPAKMDMYADSDSGRVRAQHPKMGSISDKSPQAADSMQSPRVLQKRDRILLERCQRLASTAIERAAECADPMVTLQCLINVAELRAVEMNTPLAEEAWIEAWKLVCSVFLQKRMFWGGEEWRACRDVCDHGLWSGCPDCSSHADHLSRGASSVGQHVQSFPKDPPRERQSPACNQNGCRCRVPEKHRGSIPVPSVVLSPGLAVKVGHCIQRLVVVASILHLYGTQDEPGAVSESVSPKRSPARSLLITYPEILGTNEFFEKTLGLMIDAGVLYAALARDIVDDMPQFSPGDVDGGLGLTASRKKESAPSRFRCTCVGITVDGLTPSKIRRHQRQLTPTFLPSIPGRLPRGQDVKECDYGEGAAVDPSQRDVDSESSEGSRPAGRRHRRNTSRGRAMGDALYNRLFRRPSSKSSPAAVGDPAHSSLKFAEIEDAARRRGVSTGVLGAGSNYAEDLTADGRPYVGSVEAFEVASGEAQAAHLGTIVLPMPAPPASTETDSFTQSEPESSLRTVSTLPMPGRDNRALYAAYLELFAAAEADMTPSECNPRKFREVFDTVGEKSSYRRPRGLSGAKNRHMSPASNASRVGPGRDEGRAGSGIPLGLTLHHRNRSASEPMATRGRTQRMGQHRNEKAATMRYRPRPEDQTRNEPSRRQGVGRGIDVEETNGASPLPTGAVTWFQRLPQAFHFGNDSKTLQRPQSAQLPLTQDTSSNDHKTSEDVQLASSRAREGGTRKTGALSPIPSVGEKLTVENLGDTLQGVSKEAMASGVHTNVAGGQPANYGRGNVAKQTKHAGHSLSPEARPSATSLENEQYVPVDIQSCFYRLRLNATKYAAGSLSLHELRDSNLAILREILSQQSEKERELLINRSRTLENRTQTASKTPADGLEGPEPNESNRLSPTTKSKDGLDLGSADNYFVGSGCQFYHFFTALGWIWSYRLSLEQILLCAKSKTGSTSCILDTDVRTAGISALLRRRRSAFWLDAIYDELHSGSFPQIATIASVLEYISFEDLVSVCYSVLLANSVIVTSKFARRLNSALEAILLLIRPFRWPNVFIPSVTHSSLAALEGRSLGAKHPFIIGCTSPVGDRILHLVQKDLMVEGCENQDLEHGLRDDQMPRKGSSRPQSVRKRISDLISETYISVVDLDAGVMTTYEACCVDSLLLVNSDSSRPQSPSRTGVAQSDSRADSSAEDNLKSAEPQKKGNASMQASSEDSRQSSMPSVKRKANSLLSIVPYHLMAKIQHQLSKSINNFKKYNGSSTTSSGGRSFFRFGTAAQSSLTSENATSQGKTKFGTVQVDLQAALTSDIGRLFIADGLQRGMEEAMLSLFKSYRMFLRDEPPAEILQQVTTQSLHIGKVDYSSQKYVPLVEVASPKSGSDSEEPVRAISTSIPASEHKQGREDDLSGLTHSIPSLESVLDTAGFLEFVKYRDARLFAAGLSKTEHFRNFISERRPSKFRDMFLDQDSHSGAFEAKLHRRMCCRIKRLACLRGQSRSGFLSVTIMEPLSDQCLGVQSELGWKTRRALNAQSAASTKGYVLLSSEDEGGEDACGDDSDWDQSEGTNTGMPSDSFPDQHQRALNRSEGTQSTKMSNSYTQSGTTAPFSAEKKRWCVLGPTSLTVYRSRSKHRAKAQISLDPRRTLIVTPSVTKKAKKSAGQPTPIELRIYQSDEPIRPRSRSRLGLKGQPSLPSEVSSRSSFHSSSDQESSIAGGMSVGPNVQPVTYGSSHTTHQQTPAIYRMQIRADSSEAMEEWIAAIRSRLVPLDMWGRMASVYLNMDD